MIENAKTRRGEGREVRRGRLHSFFAIFANFASSRSQAVALQGDTKISTLIVGLGNPGPEYRETRHNVGFRVVELLAQRHGIDLRKRRHQAAYGEGRIAGHAVLLAKPLTYMNLSGQAVAALARYHNLTPSEVLVVCDDTNLPLGRLRLRAQGSAGGHNGLKSIIGSLQTTEFPRVRIGVGAPDGQAMVEHVLGRFDRAESEAIAATLEMAADAVELILREGVEVAMNRYNPAPSAPLPAPGSRLPAKGRPCWEPGAGSGADGAGSREPGAGRVPAEGGWCERGE
jgi:PTH1 family peptidyl-tRNA hydrolase